MPSILFTSDWQCSVTNLDRCRMALQQVLDILREERRSLVRIRDPIYVVHLGDLKDAFNPVDQRVQNFIVEAVSRIKAECKGVFVLRGNHDSITTQDGSPSCMPIAQSAGARTIDSEATTDYFEQDRIRFAIHFVPYFRDPERQKAELKKAANFNAEGSRILAFHNEVSGCQRTPHTKGNGLSLADLGTERYDLCIGGHIHGQQKVTGNVWYVGSPFHCDWGEANEKKGFLLVRVTDRGVSVYQIPSQIPGWYDPSVPGFTKPKSWKGCHVRVSIPAKPRAEKELRPALEKEYPGAVIHIVPYFGSDSVPSATVQWSPSKSDEELLRDYLRNVTLPEGANVEQMIAYLRRFLPGVGSLGVQSLRFRSVEAQETLCFQSLKLDLDRKGLTLVTGDNTDWDGHSNGAGKTGAVSVPFIALFGRTFKDQTFDEWARQGSDSPCKVELKLDLANGETLTIVRGRRPPVFRVFQAGREITMGTANATQTLLERITNVTWDVLTAAVYVGQREIGAVFGTEKERRELFSRLLGLNRFLDAQEKLRKEVLKRQRALDELDMEIAAAEAAAKEATRNLVIAEENLRNAPAADPARRKKLVRELEDLSAGTTRMQNENTDRRRALEENQARYERVLGNGLSFDSRARVLMESLEKSEKLKGEQCPLCGSKVSIEHLERYHKDLKRQIEQAETEAERYEAIQRQNRADRQKMLEALRENDLEIEEARNSIMKTQEELATLDRRDEDRKRLAELMKECVHRQWEITRRMRLHERARVFCAEEKLFAEACASAVGREGLPAYLCSLAAPQLNAAALRYSQLFTDGEIGLEFKLADGEIDVEVRNLHGGTGVKDQSMGEMRMAGLIAALAFRETLVPHNLLILDEPSEGMDAANAARFAKGLRSVVDRFGSVFLITHNPHVLAEVDPDYHLTIRKEGGIAVVREEE